MKSVFIWLMVAIFTLFSNGYAELSIQEENLTYREELITFINEQEQELLDSAREIFEHRLPEYASEPFTSENIDVYKRQILTQENTTMDLRNSTYQPMTRAFGKRGEGI